MGSTLWVLTTLMAVVWAAPALAAGAAAPAQTGCSLGEECGAEHLRPERIGLASLPADAPQVAVLELQEANGQSTTILDTFAFEGIPAAEAEHQEAEWDHGPLLAWGGAASWPGIHWSADAQWAGGETMQIAAVGSLSYRVFDPGGFSGTDGVGQSGEGEGGSPAARGISDALIAAVLALIGVVAVARRSPTNT